MDSATAQLRPRSEVKSDEPSAGEILLLPIELHVFEHEGQYYAFDCRNYAILKVDRVGAEVMRRAHAAPLEAIVAELADIAAPEVVRSRYRRLIDLLVQDVLSMEPVPRPSRPPFDHLVIMLAGGCNMGCSYCFEKDVPIYQKPNVLSRERADEILDWFFRHQEGPKAHIQLYGGEPLLNWPILQHVVDRAERWAEESEIELTKYLITNGTLLNDERVAWLAHRGVTIQVSVDGDAETHDRFRTFKNGRSTMATIKPNLERLATHEADYNLRAVLTRENKDPQKVISGLRALGAPRVSFEVVATDAAAAQFNDDDWSEFLELYSSYVQAPFSDWAGVPEEMKSVILKICQQRRIFYGCGAGLSEVTVSPDGSIYECQRIYREPYSHIREDRSPAELKSSFLTMVDDRPVCQDCWARYLCGGGCMHQAHTGHGLDDPLPQYCEMKRGLVEASIVKIEQIRGAMAADPPALS